VTIATPIKSDHLWEEQERACRLYSEVPHATPRQGGRRGRAARPAAGVYRSGGLGGAGGFRGDGQGGNRD
jgi:hypothetical protein